MHRNLSGRAETTLTVAGETKPKGMWLATLAATHHGPWVRERDLRPRESKEGGPGKEEGQVEKVGQEGWGEIPHRQELHEGKNQAWIMSPHSLASN